MSPTFPVACAVSMRTAGNVVGFTTPTNAGPWIPVGGRWKGLRAHGQGPLGPGGRQRAEGLEPDQAWRGDVGPVPWAPMARSTSRRKMLLWAVHRACATACGEPQLRTACRRPLAALPSASSAGFLGDSRPGADRRLVMAHGSNGRLVENPAAHARPPDFRFPPTGPR